MDRSADKYENPSQIQLSISYFSPRDLNSWSTPELCFEPATPHVYRKTQLGLLYDDRVFLLDNSDIIFLHVYSSVNHSPTCHSLTYSSVAEEKRPRR